MNFVDATLVKLADPATRAGLFDDTALGQLVSAAYDATTLGVTGPFDALFDEVQLGVSASAIGRVEGTWALSGAATRTEARFDLGGLPSFPVERVDALWRGAIVARTIPDTAPVQSVEIEQPWVAANGDAYTTQARVTFAAPPVDDVPSPRRLPMSVGILIRDAGFSVADLLWESKVVRERLDPAGVERAGNGAPRPHHPIVIAWIVPAAVFDDADWPGATPGMTPPDARGARRLTAGQWLAREGIGLVVV